MTKGTVGVKETDTIQHAAELMQQYDVGILPVVCDGKLCGVITDRDIVTRGVCKSKDVCDIPVSNCMSKSTVCANPDQQIEDAAKTMAAEQVLPEQKLIYARWLHTDCIATAHQVEVHSQAHWKLMEDYIRAAAQVGVNMILVPVHTPPLDTAEGIQRPCVQLVEIEKRDNQFYLQYIRML